NHDEVLNMAVEFDGDGIQHLTMAHRLSIANMTTEWGALAGVFPFDETLKAFLIARAKVFEDREDHEPKWTLDDVEHWAEARLQADRDAVYAIELELDLASVIPHVSGPDHVKTMHALPDIQKERVRVHKAYLLSCVNARLDDLHDASAVLKGKQVADHVKFYVAAASAETQEAAMSDGTWKTFVDAGAVMLPPGCGPCIGLGEGTLDDGEVGISATNRNFKGRMGSRDAKTYLASPAVVAASAVAGYITAPAAYERVQPRFTVQYTAEAEAKAGSNGAPAAICDATPSSPLTSAATDASASENNGASSNAGQATADVKPRSIGEVEILDRFPATMRGRLLWLPVDNLNTDGIYSGKMTYRDDVTPEEMAAAAMANYDPEFGSTAELGDIVVSGRNFGTGSSREQAATCLKLRGIQCVVAESVSETYRRNAFNNGFIVLECPGLTNWLRRRNAQDATRLKNQGPATITGPEATVDFRRSKILVEDEAFTFAPLSTTAQALIVAGGAENLARVQLERENESAETRLSAAAQGEKAPV
ncbi:MAG: aconitase family protein, partial [Planctomycetota bacterium]